jgi:predicted amidophosphoribosyltransferase
MDTDLRINAVDIDREGSRIRGMNMNSDQSVDLNKAQTFCSNCHKKVKKGEAYHYHLSVLCEDCCIDMHTPHVRKTHWQYLRSIKADYLRFGRTD